MPDSLLDSRGYFWPAGLTVPDGHFAHPASVTGRLKINNSGRIGLDLDGHLPGDEPGALLSRVFRRGQVEGAIAGVLIGTDERVWLGDLVANGANAHANGPSTEAYLPHLALISTDPVFDDRRHRFRQIEFPLDGLEGWLGLSDLKADRTPRGVRASYVKPKTQQWRLQSDVLELQRWLDGILPATGRPSIVWRERALLRLVRKQPVTVEEAVELAQKVEDFLILLTDSNRGLDFPRLRLKAKGSPVRLYYPRMGRGAEPVSWHRSWAMFPACESSFGAMFGKWLALHDQMGPGVHLYLGNRRGHPMYPEHRFASLVWGLEALHRASYPNSPNPRLAAKVQRILSSIALEKDRVWAERMLPSDDEPSLASRLREILATLPLNFEASELRAFAERCAGRRNDISHFGGRRSPEDGDAFDADIQTLSPALALLYHALLLKLTGLPDHLVRRQFHGGTNDYQSRRTLGAAGLNLPDAAA